MLAVGGLMAADGRPVSGALARAAAPKARAAQIRQGRDSPSTLEVGRESVSWKDCHTGPFTLGPWQSQWVGHIGSTPQFQCEPGWTRHINARCGRCNMSQLTTPASAGASSSSGTTLT